MNAGFSADAEALARHAGRFDGLADDVGRIYRELRDLLSESGACWGSDAIGQSFAAGHVGQAEATVAGLGELPARLGDMGGKLAATAAAYRVAEERSAAEFGPAEAGAGEPGAGEPKGFGFGQDAG